MSLNIWTQCAASSSVFVYREAQVWRVAESQQRISTRQLVDSDAEHEVLEALVEENKPPLPDEGELGGYHFLLSSPFRYAPLAHGSRFGTRAERSLWYASEELETALAEAAYYRLLFFSGTEADLLPNRVTMSAFQAAVASRATVDLTQPPFDVHRGVLCSKDDYTATRLLGAEMRNAGAHMVRFLSARHPKQGVNVGLFTPAAFAMKKPLGPPLTWYCTVTPSRDVSWMREEVAGMTSVEFAQAVFLVNGKLPAPAF
ncbi:MAG TPA: RES family NAD+ phosphorylase [Anaeromyxobacteraceae bacterium]|nr:RES family NAD+ phosphorylase [Anaeromyxobacteraceae bacterium]